jgi:WD40 repeat protein
MRFPLRIAPAQTRQVQELKHSAPLLGCRIDPSGRFVFAGSQDNTVQRWELTGGIKTTFTGHSSWVRALAFASQHRIVISGDYHGKVFLWQTDGNGEKPLRSFDAHDGWVRAVCVRRDGGMLATCGNDRLINLWSLPDGKLIRSLDGHEQHVYNVAFAPNGNLASCDLKGVVKLWDTAKGTCVRNLDAAALYKYDPTFRADIGGARAMSFSSDGALLICAGISEVTNAFAGVGKPLVVLFDVAAGQRKHLLKPKEAFQGTAWGSAFHIAGFVIGVGGGNGGALWFWDQQTGECVATIKLPNNSRDLSLHPDGIRLAIPFFDGAVRIYDMSPNPPKAAKSK